MPVSPIKGLLAERYQSISDTSLLPYGSVNDLPFGRKRPAPLLKKDIELLQQSQIIYSYLQQERMYVVSFDQPVFNIENPDHDAIQQIDYCSIEALCQMLTETGVQINSRFRQDLLDSAINHLQKPVIGKETFTRKLQHAGLLGKVAEYCVDHLENK